MEVTGVVVHLPDLDDGVANGIAMRIEDSAGQVRNVADGRRDRIVDDEQIVVGIERQVIGIERPFRLRRRAHELFGEDAGGIKRACGEGGGAEAEACKEAAAGVEVCIHGMAFRYWYPGATIVLWREGVVFFH